MQVQIGEHPVTIFALDTPTSSPVGEPGIGVVVDRAHAEAVWEIVLAGAPAGRRPVRAIGWNAFNIARLEAGTPLFHLDFGPDALPHETGVLADRVSFTKGCYPGQEVVARMESRGKSKRRVVGLRGTTDALPITGAQIFDETEGVGSQVGVVTGSTIAPMRGAAIIAIASIRTSHVAVGTRVLVNAEGEMVPAVVTALDFELPGSPEPEDSEGAES
jgi:folate-binding protein YgfZ